MDNFLILPFLLWSDIYITITPFYELIINFNVLVYIGLLENNFFIIILLSIECVCVCVCV